jgi:hypothetical protein
VVQNSVTLLGVATHNLRSPTVIMGNYTSNVKKKKKAVGCAMAQAVSRRLSPRRPVFTSGSIHVGFVVDKVALGQVFLRALRFSPVNIILPSLSKLISSGGWTICPLVAAAQRRLTPSKSVKETVEMLASWELHPCLYWKSLSFVTLRKRQQFCIDLVNLWHRFCLHECYLV